MRNLLLILVLFFTVTSCEKLFMKPKPSSDNEAIFLEYTKLVREKYAMLDFKGVDIDFLEDSIRNTITSSQTRTEILVKCATITARLRDGHSSLIDFIDPNQAVGYVFDIQEGYPRAFNDTIVNNIYIGTSVAPNMTYLDKGTDEVGRITYRIVYGFLPQDNDIAYIRIPEFTISLSDEELDNIFETIAPSKGLILDVRGNGGGSPSLATKFASYFMENTTYTGFEKFKTGPGDNDFTNSPSNVTPAESDFRYLKPVYVLTDRGVYSATTTLCYSLNPLPQVTFIGQRTGGGSGSVADGYLSNGFNWSLSTSEFIDHLGNHLDDGIDPDIQVSLDLNDETKDEIIEKAILDLQ